MKIVLLNNYTAVIVDRSAQIAGDEIDLEVGGVEIPNGSSLVAMCGNGISHYQEIKDGRCTLPTKHLDGVIPIFIKVFDEKVLTWKCEALYCQRLADGVLVSPNDSDLPEEFAKLKLENDEIRNYIRELEDHILKFNKELNDMKRGWNVV